MIQEALADVKGTFLEFDIEWVDLFSRGLMRISQGGIDLVLLDLSLPDSRGLETFTRISRQAHGIPVIVLTGLYDEITAIKAVHEGAQDYLVKGQVDGSLLIRSISYAIERQKIEEELRTNNDLNQLILKALPFGIEIVTEEGDIVYLSDKFVAMLGKEAVGKKCWMVHKDDKIQCYDCSLKSGIKIGEVKSIEAQGIARGKIYQITHIGIEYQGKKAILEIFNDITERRRIEQMKSDFVALVSHQLKTPVGQLRGYIDNMVNGITGQLQDKQKQYLQEMQAISSRAYRLISDLLSVSNIERGIIAVSLQQLQLKAIAEQLVKEYSVDIRRKGLELVCQGLDKEVSVLADKDKLIEAVSNVMNNAVRFTEKGSITITIDSRANYGILEVKDTGRGLSADLLPKIFTREQTLSGTPTSEGGAGLGLYIAKRFMELQDGDITVESTEGKGSKFIFKIPLVMV